MLHWTNPLICFLFRCRPIASAKCLRRYFSYGFSEILCKSTCKCNSKSLCGCMHNHQIGETNIPYQAVSQTARKFAEGLIRGGNTEPKVIVPLVHKHFGNRGKSNVGEDGRAINVSGADASNFNAKTAINLINQIQIEEGSRKDASDVTSAVWQPGWNR